MYRLSISLSLFVCSLILLSIPVPAQTLIGKQIRFERTYPDANHVFISSVVTVDNSVEVDCPSPGAGGPGCGDNINQGGYSIDIQADKILFRTAASGSSFYGRGTCNCFRFTLLNPGTTYFANVSLSATNIPGFGSGNVTFTDTTITFNVAGLPAPANASLDLDIQLGDNGPLTVYPSSLSFTGAYATSMNGPVQELYIAVGENQVGRGFTVTAPQGIAWLSVDSTSNTTPSTVRVLVNPQRITPDTYTTKIDIKPAGAKSPISVPITFEVDTQRPFHLNVERPVSIGTVNGAGAAITTLSNSGSGGKVIHFLWDNNSLDMSSIVTYTPSQVTVDSNIFAQLNFRAQGAALIRKHGSLIAYDSANNPLGTIPVSVEPSPGATELDYDQSALLFNALADSPDATSPAHVPLNKTLWLKTLGPDIVSFNVAPDSGGGHWLSASPVTSMTGSLASVIVTANAGGLKAGGYQGKIDILYNSTFDAQSPAATHRTITIPVFLNVLASGSAVPAEIEFQGRVPLVVSPGQSQLPAINLFTTSLVPVTYNLTDTYLGNPAFFMHSPDSVTGSQQDALKVQLSIRPGVPLNQGIYHGELVITGGGPADKPDRLQVLGVIPPGYHAMLAAPRAVDACTPTKIGVVAGLPLFNFTAQTGSPILLDIGTADDCGNLGGAGQVVVSFSNGDPSVSLLQIDTGRWRGTWAPSNALAPVVATVTAYPTLENLAPATTVLQGSVTADPKAVILFDGAILNGASLERDAPVAPGSFVSLFGSNLASGKELASVLPLSESLQDASATINGRAMPIHFASPDQVNAILPYDLPSGELTIVAKNGTGSSVGRKIQVVQVAPGVFQYGANRGVVIGTHADGSQVLTDADHPVRAGDPIVIYCTGLGEVDTSVPAGTQAPPKLVHTINAITATIGGKDAKVDYAGLSPGSTGLYQVNTVVPAGVAPGDSVELILTGGGFSSTPVFMSVR